MMEKSSEMVEQQVNKKPTILYIEDNLDNRKLVKRVLQAAGYVVHGVADGPSGFEYLQSHIPDLILMDIHLPGMDGYTMTRQLRQLEQFTHVPIITLTANVTKEDQEESQQAGANGFIQKPISVDNLPDQIRSYLVNNK
ncbi:MAG: response regulator [Anaerolineales bacterium]|nr:response regulator [Anaerolineales bacterium]MCB8987106.1 response regulator [Ardenticatenaceae bacterium]